MNWKKMLAYITGSVDEELQRRNEYLVAENRILRSRLHGSIRLNNAERIRLAEIGKRLGRKALAEVAQIVSPETILAWHRRLVARKIDGTKGREGRGRPAIPAELVAMVVKVAEENRTWGYDRIVGAMKNLGHNLSRQSVANVFKRNGLEPAPERGRRTTWKAFIRSHLAVLAATDFFTAEVWTSRGLITYYVLFVMRVAQRRIHVVEISSAPDGLWMDQIARSLTLADVGFLSGCRYLLHDRDTKFTAAFDAILRSAGVEPVTLLPHSPNLNAYAERWVRSVKEECLSKLILFGEGSLRHALCEFVQHFHQERNHQGKENVILFPEPADRLGADSGAITSRERLGGLLRF
jgi:putative transposase